MKLKLLPCLAACALACGSPAIAQTASAPASAQAAENVAIKSGESVAFLGDSITQLGADLPGGYVRRIISGLKVNGIDVTPYPEGVGGNKSNQMLERLGKDVLSKKPTWMTLSCGVNDVWQGEQGRGIPLDQYKTNITSIVDQAQAAGVKVMILTATMIQEDPNTANNKKLAAYNDFLRQLAKEKGCLLADLNADMQAGLKPEIKRRQFTFDGVHMNPLGDEMMAVGVLRAFNLNDAQIQKAKDFWINMPEVACRVNSPVGLTLREYRQLTELADQQNKTIGDYIATEAAKVLKARLKP